VRILETLSAGVAGQIVRCAVREQPVVVRLPLAGLHNARNAAAALAVAVALDVPAPAAAAALAATQLPPHRSFPRPAGGRIVLDDCYNANSASMTAALESVIASAATSSPPGRAFAILGDMLELGPESAALHHEIGRVIGTRLAGLATVGTLAAEIARGAQEAGLPASKTVAVATPAEAAAAVAAWTRPGDWILVKASRGMRLERAVDALIENFSSGSR
jgi:UDP-N-acetylmuramyl pentapeptide synthase